jgi:hypothetical protein
MLLMSSAKVAVLILLLVRAPWVAISLSSVGLVHPGPLAVFLSELLRLLATLREVLCRSKPAAPNRALVVKWKLLAAMVLPSVEQLLFVAVMLPQQQVLAVLWISAVVLVPPAVAQCPFPQPTAPAAAAISSWLLALPTMIDLELLQLAAAMLLSPVVWLLLLGPLPVQTLLVAIYPSLEVQEPLVVPLTSPAGWRRLELAVWSPLPVARAVSWHRLARFKSSPLMGLPSLGMCLCLLGRLLSDLETWRCRAEPVPETRLARSTSRLGLPLWWAGRCLWLLVMLWLALVVIFLLAVDLVLLVVTSTLLLVPARLAMAVRSTWRLDKARPAWVASWLFLRADQPLVLVVQL